MVNFNFSIPTEKTEQSRTALWKTLYRSESRMLRRFMDQHYRNCPGVMTPGQFLDESILVKFSIKGSSAKLQLFHGLCLISTRIFNSFHQYIFFVFIYALLKRD